MPEAVVTRGYLEGPQGPLFTCRVTPPEDVTPAGSILMLGPFGEEKKSSRRTLHELAITCAEANWSSLSIDFTGTGDSPGHHGDLTVKLMIEEAAAGRDHLAATGPAPVLLGVRLGASIACRLAASGPNSGIVLIQPVPFGGKFLWNTLRRKQVREMMTAGASTGVTAKAKKAFESGRGFDLDGFEVSACMARGLEGLEIASMDIPPDLPALIIGCGPKGRAPADVKKVATHLSESRTEAWLDLEPFWDRIERTSTAELDRTVIGFLEAQGR